MKLKHTPGPWKLLKNDDDRDYGRIPYFYIIKGECDIAEIHDDSHDYNYKGYRIDYQQAEANARLISTATEILEALIKYRSYIPETFEMESGITYVDGLIEKATGLKIEEVLKNALG